MTLVEIIGALSAFALAVGGGAAAGARWRASSAQPRVDEEANTRSGSYDMVATRRELERVERLAMSALEGLSHHERECADARRQQAERYGQMSAQLGELLRRTDRASR